MDGCVSLNVQATPLGSVIELPAHVVTGTVAGDTVPPPTQVAEIE